MVMPGGRIPVDGIVVGGESFVDESSITGEPMPVAKREGKRVFAGTINESGALEIRTERVGRDTTFGHIIDAVERAEHQRAPIQRIADRMAGYLVYVALGAAAATWLVTRDARATISVILVAGACGVAAGTPLAILGAIGRAAGDGVIIKAAVTSSAMGIDTVVLDKTGTLTFGTCGCAQSIPPRGLGSQVLEAAATAECRSSTRSAAPSSGMPSNSDRRPKPTRFPEFARRGRQRVAATRRFWWLKRLHHSRSTDRTTGEGGSPLFLSCVAASILVDRCHDARPRPRHH